MKQDSTRPYLPAYSHHLNDTDPMPWGSITGDAIGRLRGIRLLRSKTTTARSRAKESKMKHTYAPTEPADNHKTHKQ
jgi:hypothetical protein